MALWTTPRGPKALYDITFYSPHEVRSNSFINIEFQVSLVVSGQHIEKVGYRGSMEGLWGGKNGLEKSWVGLRASWESLR